jgi:hypothetical protein
VIWGLEIGARSAPSFLVFYNLINIFQGHNDTQAAESSFRALKHYEKVEFGQTTPHLGQLIPVIIKVLQDRNKQRLIRITNKRVKIHHDNPNFKEALDKASYVLNSAGITVFYDTLKLMEARSHLMELDEEENIIENYDGRWSKGYVGNYSTNGDICSCSTYKNSFFCRHLLFYRQSTHLPLFEKSMFHRRHLIDGTEGDWFDEEESFRIDAENLPVSPSNGNLCDTDPNTPGGSILDKEHHEKTKRMPKNVKFNKAFDVAKVQAEVLSQLNQKTFESHLKASKNFLALIREGLPNDLMEYLSKPEEYKIIKASDDHNATVEIEVAEDTLAEQVKPSLPEGFYEIPEDVRDDAVEKLGFDCAVMKIPSDGGCFYAAVCQSLFNTTDYSRMRYDAHKLMCDWFYYYRPVTGFPFVATVGVGDGSYMKWINNELEFLQFLHSEESLKSFIETDVDMKHLCNMFNVSIHVCTFNVQGVSVSGADRIRWLRHDPDPEVVPFSPFSYRSHCHCYLLHEDEAHFELIVPRPPTQPVTITGNIDNTSENTTEDNSDLIGENNVANDIRSEEAIAPLSPMYMAPGVKSRGRPSKKRGGAPVFNKTKRKRVTSPEPTSDSIQSTAPAAAPAASAAPAAPPKKRGRPVGSKNKPKDGAKETKKRGRPVGGKNETKAANTTQSRIDRASRAASWELCRACGFDLDHHEEEVNCPTCDLLIHKDCLRGDGCPVCEPRFVPDDGYPDFSDLSD